MSSGDLPVGLGGLPQASGTLFGSYAAWRVRIHVRVQSSHGQGQEPIGRTWPLLLRAHRAGIDKARGKFTELPGTVGRANSGTCLTTHFSSSTTQQAPHFLQTHNEDVRLVRCRHPQIQPLCQ
jgi:hypothetical protein